MGSPKGRGEGPDEKKKVIKDYRTLFRRIKQSPEGKKVDHERGDAIEKSTRKESERGGGENKSRRRGES